MNAELDHLVVAAADLDQAAAWCEATLGVAPLPGGRHALMGTHNRLVNLSAPESPRRYLELIAIDPAAPVPGRPRWFGLDDAALQARLERDGPQLIHAVLRHPNIDMLRWGLMTLGCQPGTLTEMARDTAAGPLRWRMLLRDDGAIDLGGHLPSLIQWQDAHPADALPASPITLQTVTLGGLPARVRQMLRLRGALAQDSGAALSVRLDTPRGDVMLQTGDANA